MIQARCMKKGVDMKGRVALSGVPAKGRNSRKEGRVECDVKRK
jgi:hypothetical protein